MKNYEKPIITINEELAEGVYAASGDCYTFTAEIVQDPKLGHEVYTIQMNGDHAATDGHHSSTRTVAISFNMPVIYNSSNAAEVVGSGTNTLYLTFIDGTNGSYHNNASDKIGLGQLLVKADEGLAITSIYCVHCNRTCTQGH